MLCAQYADAAEAGGRLVVVTPAGVITGVPAQPLEGDSIYAKINNAAIQRYQMEYQPESPIGGSDGCFMLLDVTLQSGKTATNLPHMMVFYDQIVGITAQLEEK